MLGVYLTSRGDTGLRIWHVNPSGSKTTALKEINNSRLAGNPVLDFCLLPKPALDAVGCEMARLLRLTQNSIDPVRVEIPRKDKSRLDEGLFVDTVERGEAAPLSSADFVAGADIPAPPVVSVSLPKAVSIFDVELPQAAELLDRKRARDIARGKAKA